jgi:sphinganine C4-monooxygenase
VLDTAGAGLAYKATFLTQRMGLLFFVFSTIKTVDDHCGYSLPFDPMQHITSNNAAYHDIHHQSWGIKSNFSQPFFTIWDRLLGTMWKGDVKAKYERTRAAAAGKVGGGGSGSGSGKENGNGNANGGKKKAAAAANGKVKAK